MTEKEKIELLKPIMGSAKMSARALEYLSRQVKLPEVGTIAEDMGVSDKVAAKVRSVALLASCYLLSTNTAKITSSSAAVELVPELKCMDKEHLVVITMTPNYEMLGKHVLTIGSSNRTIVDPRDIYGKAYHDGATCVVVFHNHPSGNLTPSREDIFFTTRLSMTGRDLGIKLCDSIIVAKTGFTSLRHYYPEIF